MHNKLNKRNHNEHLHPTRTTVTWWVEYRLLSLWMKIGDLGEEKEKVILMLRCTLQQLELLLLNSINVCRLIRSQLMVALIKTNLH